MLYRPHLGIRVGKKDSFKDLSKHRDRQREATLFYSMLLATSASHGCNANKAN
jgi:hypothetical protein